MKHPARILVFVVVGSGGLLLYLYLSATITEKPKPVSNKMEQGQEYLSESPYTKDFKMQTLTMPSDEGGGRGGGGVEEEKEGEERGHDAEITQRFSTRLKTLHQACARYATSPAFRQRGGTRIELSLWPYRNISVHYCAIPKISSQTWSGLLGSIRQKVSKTTSSWSNRTMNRNQTMKQVRFVFVRDPYSRLVSAYTDKLYSFNSLNHKIGRYIVANFRPNASASSLSCGHGVTFAEFIKYVIHSQETGMNRDPHFIPRINFCDLCLARYDVIGKLETLKKDMEYVLNAIQSPVQYTRNYPKSIVKKNISQILRTLSSKMRQCIGMDEGLRRLWRKCQIRGLIGKDQLYPFTPEESENITAEMMISAAHAAMDRSAPAKVRSSQKTEALREAFAYVPLQDRLKLKELLFLDFQLFGYDPEPEAVFPKEPLTSADSFRYFDPFDH